jgi:WhiB family redox-sensing transcriptional regulator
MSSMILLSSRLRVRSSEFVGTDQKVENFADRSFAHRRLGQRKMVLHDVAVPPALSFFEHVTGAGQIAHDRVGASFGDAEERRNVTQTHAGVVRNAQQRAPVIRQKPPFGHDVIIASYFEYCSASILSTTSASLRPTFPFGHEPWLERGACRPYPTAWWFSNDLRETAAAKNICFDCPVRAECLEYAVTRPALLGIWAATKTAERAAIRDERFAHPAA